MKTNSEIVEYDVYSPYQYPWMSLNFFVGFWIVSNAVRLCLNHVRYSSINEKFSHLNEDKKRNCVTYVLQFFVTLLAFILQLYGGVDILFRLEEYTSTPRMNSMILAMILIAVLYTWELCYRQTIGWPLLIHHIVTLLLIQCSTASYLETLDSIYIRYAMLLGFHATTEQMSFVALFAYRLCLMPRFTSFLFYAATIQAFVFKTIVTIASLVLYTINMANKDVDKSHGSWGTFWKIFLVPLVLILYSSQVYACTILYSLAVRSKSSKEDVTTDRDDSEPHSQAVKDMSALQDPCQERNVAVLNPLESFGAVLQKESTNRASPSISSQNGWESFSEMVNAFSARDIENIDWQTFKESNDEDRDFFISSEKKSVDTTDSGYGQTFEMTCSYSL